MRQAERPLVSVIMNCYNGEKYLRQAIDSVLAQTYPAWEIVFWDNRSTDDSAKIFNSYVDARLKYFMAPKHTWLYEARNHAIEKANGDIVAFLDVDDRWLPDKLAKQVPLFADPQVGFVCGNYWIESELKNKRWKALRCPVPTGMVLENLLKRYFIGLLTLMVRRSALASLDYPCDPRYHVIGDLDLAVRLSVHWKLDYVHDPVACYRLHGNNELVKHRSRHNDELDCWLGEMERNSVIRSSPGFSAAKVHVAYTKAMHRILQGDKRAAYNLAREMAWGKPKLRLLFALCLPDWAIRGLKR
jgi:glycosyltransferase involved in cell wall biosynthesis